MPKKKRIKKASKIQMCGNIGPRESTSPCILEKGHTITWHMDNNGGEWL